MPIPCTNQTKHITLQNTDCYICALIQAALPKNVIQSVPAALCTACNGTASDPFVVAQIAKVQK
jgi:hypothetical protein